MLACDTSITPHDFPSAKSYFGQLCLARRGGCAIKKKSRSILIRADGVVDPENLLNNHPARAKLLSVPNLS
jgi:hypothetical protein